MRINEENYRGSGTATATLEEQESAVENATGQHAGDHQPAAKRHHGPEERSRRRFRIKATAQITRFDAAVVEPEVVTLVDASIDGILFATNQDYAVGTELLVRFPYPSSTSPRQSGSVVRVKILEDGTRHVGVALG